MAEAKGISGRGDVEETKINLTVYALLNLFRYPCLW